MYYIQFVLGSYSILLLNTSILGQVPAAHGQVTVPQSGEDDLQPDLHHDLQPDLQPDLAEPGAGQLELPRPVRPPE